LKESRVWLVLVGDTLYVDRNDNGTAAGSGAGSGSTSFWWHFAGTLP
jgi:hypothetical protein